jgi:hypothetical protein
VLIDDERSTIVARPGRSSKTILSRLASLPVPHAAPIRGYRGSLLSLVDDAKHSSLFAREAQVEPARLSFSI